MRLSRTFGTASFLLQLLRKLQTMKYLFLLVFIYSSSIKSFAGTVDTVSIYSNSMHKYINAVVIKPDSYKKKRNSFPVVYLLHGYSGNYSNWITKVPELNKYADTYQTLIVCPDGAYSSWYFDSPLDTSYKYETHVATEVVNFIDKNYRSIADKNHRAITGLSMGGHGALFLALRHPDIFGAAGSMSGGVDLKESKNRFDISKRIGDTTLHAKEWHDLTVINLIENYTNTDVKIIFDCGARDIFIDGNRRLHQKMLQLKIQHEYVERPGEHNWQYWSNAIPFQLLFFQRFFLSGR
jgi:S-formylglutathione hydrolase FrmB